MVNNKNLNTKSNKIRKISKINSYIVNKIDENQSIRRYLRYLTKKPLSKTSVDLAGNKVNQPDLLNSLRVESNEGDAILTKGSFNEETISKEFLGIFVHTYSGRFKDISGTIKVAVNILIPQLREELAYDELERSTEIATIISDIFDDMVIINDEYIDVGEVKLDLVDCNIGRLSKTNNIVITTLVFDANIVAMRGR